jgi:hypothetical protein
MTATANDAELDVPYPELLLWMVKGNSSLFSSKDRFLPFATGYCGLRDQGDDHPCFTKLLVILDVTSRSHEIDRDDRQ